VGREADPGTSSGWAGYADQPPRSPWISQMAVDGPPRPLEAGGAADVVIVGAGIAGVATAFWTLRDTDRSVLLIERDRVAHGATGRNAGQLTTYFERPLHRIAEQYGDDLAIEGQRAFDDAHDLLDRMASEAGATVRVERFDGHMGMYSLDHLRVHLRDGLRREGGLRAEPCVVSEEAEFLRDIPPEFDGLWATVPQARIDELLDTAGHRYRAVLSDVKGCANSGLLVEQVLAYLERRYPGRLRYRDSTLVDRVVVRDDGRAEVLAGGHRIEARSVVLCTNGFVDHVVEDEAGRALLLAEDQRVVGTIGYMAAFVEQPLRSPAAMSYIRNAVIGGDTPYVYVTRRTWDASDGLATLTCMGGPEWPIDEPWQRDLPYPGGMLDHMDEAIRPYAQPARPPHEPYDFAWHGLMGYMPGRVRIIGPHPGRPALLYNLGCNGVGFLPSIHGGRQISRLLGGGTLPASIFDPRLG
jgi:glycine/D-amino acid oxidase-like deaminating enzyme